MHANEKMIDKMGEVLKDQWKVIEKGDLVGYSQTDYEFHGLIYKSSRNAALQDMLGSLKAKMQPITMEVRPLLPKLYEDHLEMIEAIRSKDPEKSEKLLRRHNRAVQIQIQKEIESLGRK